jgi:hypothetical protein
VPWKKMNTNYNNTIKNLSNDDDDLKNFDIDFDENEEEILPHELDQEIETFGDDDY